MVIPAMQLAGKIPDVHVQLWASALLKGPTTYFTLCLERYFSPSGALLRKYVHN